MVRIEIRLGILAPSLEDQFPNEPGMDTEELNNKAISRLYIAGLLSQNEADRARDRLVKRVVRLLEKNHL